MNEKLDDGGPAFPVKVGCDNLPLQVSENQFVMPGMSLRDYFAAKFAHAELVTCGVPGEACEALCRAADTAKISVEEQIARNAYFLADAMIKARSA